MKNIFTKEKFSLHGISLIALAIVMLWIKTYITYKTSFDLAIENGMQEFISVSYTHLTLPTKSLV